MAGSCAMPAKIQTPSTICSTRRLGREFVRSGKATPSKKTSRPSAESGGAASLNGRSNWSPGKEWWAIPVDGSDHHWSPSGIRNAPGNRRNSPHTLVRPRTTIRTAPRRARCGRNGTAGRCGRATWRRMVESRFSICETKRSRIPDSFRLRRPIDLKKQMPRATRPGQLRKD